MPRIMITRTLLVVLASLVLTPAALAQVPPSSAERAVYVGLHKAAAAGDVAAIEREVRAGSAVDLRDGHGRGFPPRVGDVPGSRTTGPRTRG